MILKEIIQITLLLIVLLLALPGTQLLYSKKNPGREMRTGISSYPRKIKRRREKVTRKPAFSNLKLEV